MTFFYIISFRNNLSRIGWDCGEYRHNSQGYKIINVSFQTSLQWLRKVKKKQSIALLRGASLSIGSDSTCFELCLKFVVQHVVQQIDNKPKVYTVNPQEELQIRQKSISNRRHATKLQHPDMLRCRRIAFCVTCCPRNTRQTEASGVCAYSVATSAAPKVQQQQ